MLDPLIIRLLNRGVDALTVRQICQHCEPGDGRNWRSWGGCPDDGSRAFSGGGGGGNNSGGGSSGGGSSGGGGGGGTPAVIQTYGGGINIDDPITIGLLNPLQSGSLMVLVAIWEEIVGSLPTPPAGWTLVQSYMTTYEGDTWLAVYTATINSGVFPASAPGSTITYSAVEISNVSLVDQVGAVQTGTASTTASSGSITPTTTNEYCIFCLVSQGAVSHPDLPVSPTNDFVEIVGIVPVVDGSDYGSWQFGLLQPSASPTSSQVTFPYACNWMGCMISLA